MKFIIWGISFLGGCSKYITLSRAQVVNECSFPVYLRTDQLDEPSVRMLHPGDTYSETYRYKMAYNPATGSGSATGVSIKISADYRLNQELNEEERRAVFGSSAITQLEYTYDPSLHPRPDLYYDVSDINDGTPRQFCAYGLALQPQSPSCPAVICPPNCQQNCSSVYNYPSDNFAAHGCQSDVDLIFFLCRSG